MTHTEPQRTRAESMQMNVGGAALIGDLTVPPAVCGVVLFAHGSGSSRHSPRNRFVAGELNKVGLGTLLLDLLTADEEAVDERTAEHRFDISLLAGRLVAAIDWLRHYSATAGLPIGLLGLARAPARPWWRQRGGRPACVRSSAEAAGPIFPPMTCRVFAHHASDRRRQRRAGHRVESAGARPARIPREESAHRSWRDASFRGTRDAGGGGPLGGRLVGQHLEDRSPVAYSRP